MICVITGFPMFGHPPSPGLKEIAADLRKQHPKTRVFDLTWNFTPEDARLEPFDEPILLIGHSFGGCSAVMLSRHLEGKSKLVHLILIDPLRHHENDRLFPIPTHDDPLAQVGGAQFDAGPSWASAIAFLRTQRTWLPPYHQGLAADENNIQVPGTNHNSIIESLVVKTIIFTKAGSLFD